MSKIKTTLVELSDIVEEANLILEVKYLEPFTEEVAVKGVDPNVPAPAFKKKGLVFTIKNVLKNKDSIALPKTIRVPNEGWRRLLSQHKEAHADGLSKSYEVKQYKTEVASMKDADIIFLHHFQNTFELEVKGSFESVAALEKITMLIAAE
jgi:hypothetical protein